MGNPKSAAEHSLGAIRRSSGSVNRVFLSLSPVQREKFLMNFIDRFRLVVAPMKPAA